MSIEDTIKELTQSIRDLTAALNKPTACESDHPQNKLATDFAKLAGGVAVIGSDGTVIEPAPAPAPNPKKAKTPKVEEPAPEPEPAAPAAPEPEPAPATKRTFTISDLREAAQKALDAGKLDEVVNLNKQYGVKRISEVPADLYEKIIAKLEAIVNGKA